jgi:hypothetical protein
LQVVHGPILQQVLTQGKRIYCTDRMLYAALIRTMLFNQSDMMPYYDRILAERRQAWIVCSLNSGSNARTPSATGVAPGAGPSG